MLAFPSNDFGGQEPGTPAQIQKFCQVRFNVKFPVMEKVKTKGTDQSPVYAFLSAKHGAPWPDSKVQHGRNTVGQRSPLFARPRRTMQGLLTLRAAPHRA